MKDRFLQEKAVYFKRALQLKRRLAGKVAIAQKHCKNHMKIENFEEGKAHRTSTCLDNFH